MKDLQTSRDKGHEYFLLLCNSKSQNALKPELYLAQVERATAEFSSSENRPCANMLLSCPMALSASGTCWIRNRLFPAYLSKPESAKDHTSHRKIFLYGIIICTGSTVLIGGMEVMNLNMDQYYAYAAS